MTDTTTTTITDLAANLWTPCALRDEAMSRYGITESTWYYHSKLATCPQPDVTLAGYKWYSDAVAREILAMFAGVAARKSRRTAAAK